MLLMGVCGEQRTKKIVVLGPVSLKVRDALGADVGSKGGKVVGNFLRRYVKTLVESDKNFS